MSHLIQSHYSFSFFQKLRKKFEKLHRHQHHNDLKKHIHRRDIAFMHDEDLEFLNDLDEFLDDR